jgi:hypothetical protein
MANYTGGDLASRTRKVRFVRKVIPGAWAECMRAQTLQVVLFLQLVKPEVEHTCSKVKIRVCDLLRPWILTVMTNFQKGISRQSSGSRWVGPSILRGPPRKPKQSGHALWVGNLPPGTNVVDLKDHFSRDATEDIESVFLISKSNCAFVNYKSVSACTAAMGRFHDSKFQGVRLVCRFRRGAAAPAGTPTGPSASQPSTPAEPLKSPAAEEERPPKQEQLVDGVAPSTDDPQEPSPKVEEKYFILKSLTVEDLELSIRNGIWATQTHNETALNKAYEVSFCMQEVGCQSPLTISSPQEMFTWCSRSTNLASILATLE